MNNNFFFIDGHELQKRQIGDFKYSVATFYLGKLESNFTVSLQPTGNIDDKPTFQLDNKSGLIPEWVKDQLPTISSWIIKEHDKSD